MTYSHALAQEPLPRGPEVYSFDRPFLSYHYFIFSLSDLCQGVENILTDIIHVHCLGERSRYLQFLISLPYLANFVQINQKR